MERKLRCGWCDPNSSLYIDYHDNEWGVPVMDDGRLFEMLILEGMQAGLSWLTVLKKRDHFRKAFDSFDYSRISVYGDDDKERLLQDSTIIRNRLKIESSIKNAQVFLDMQKEHGSFGHYLWEWVDYSPIVNTFSDTSELPAETNLSRKISKDLKKRGMNFVGPTIVYAYMQSIGMVNDHETDCFRYKECCELAAEFSKKHS